MTNDLMQECENALEKIDLLRLLSQYASFVRIADSIVGPCPFHKKGGKNTLDIHIKSRKFHCIYPKCDRRGSFIELVAAFENTDIDAACARILKFSIAEQALIQKPMPFVPQSIEKMILPEFTQTPLRKLRQCPLRYWYEYIRINEQGTKQIKEVHKDRQTIESTLGSLIHSTLKRFYGLPAATRQLSDLSSLFKEHWGKGYGPLEDREYWLEKAYLALQHAYEMNFQLNAIKIETESSRSVEFPINSPKYRLKSTADRVDWFSETEYCLIDYKWDEKPLSEQDAATDFQTVIYYLTWKGSQKGIPPKAISYQYLTYGKQIDVIPDTPTMEPGIEFLLKYIEKAEKVKNQSTEPEATLNEYCYNCKLYGICPATKPQVK